MSTLPHTPGYSRRSHEIAPFHVMSLLARAQALEQAGHDVIHLEIGEPDFTTAEPVVRAGQAALAAGHTRYTAARGLPALRQAISGFYRSHYGLDIDPERILVTPGGSGALLLASSLLVDPGRHWLLADPGYPCNRHFLRLVEGGAQLVPVGPDTAYQLTPSLVQQHWNADSVGALVASPANPTGTVLSADELAALSKTLHARGGHLVVDEIYHGLTYGLDAPSVLQVDDSAFVLNSFSKYFGMTGWRLGWLVAPPAAVPDLEKLAQNLYISASSIAQHAALACFSEASMAIFEQRREAFRQRRDFLLPALRELGFRIEIEPQGAFYLYADVSAFTDDAQAFCAHFLETEHVAFTPGLDFGFHRANQHVRLAYTQEVPRLQEAVARIARGLKRWNG
ncbi:TPA: pyridoxal phosphate-dependent aminotransferase [Stenotrophomonas maltophilia]|jgi:aspartate/methionine/tyrosine aminotransferase|uniref:Aminotransferase n=1 Tax=Stenotrophomonas maltophilia TaxID=40324 RepID=A0AAI9G1A8_STEMA|nr:pyridoxal phosphate-dependent aminotransferase [Stenotrophomonas maltophilia]MPS46260.1 pyridoxal phosphate-dependent aminotransferase [Stenotrophomonas sp.]EKT4443402.1 pyridoxal phosphate-dependent aminotransferase [Stenotrophomonas maltophilia]ELC7364952.1 pyridoxal phosphate-dependent aminotransferase [Stenotrophomonas maltophilia]ELF4110493.1 pyridoxal phosphate-dependent aminotransferase [Stenotrophomonas maltophilia]MBA0252638.1 pyridoxal phosphate-dependent aminotransferase [Stenotr